MIDAIRARHVMATNNISVVSPDWCRDDGKTWPCDTAIVLAALDGSKALGLSFAAQRDAAIEREARLRAAATKMLALEDDEDEAYNDRAWTAVVDGLRAALATTPEGE